MGCSVFYKIKKCYINLARRIAVHYTIRINVDIMCSNYAVAVQPNYQCISTSIVKCALLKIKLQCFLKHIIIRALEFFSINQMCF